ncbi:B-cell receptor CD22-like [Salarias fasciatus]|uniref:B-cell receptor CD22-like n=1 Tax=Salarias fasciatus TaxID=181472 RepID=UPI001176F7C5|nr:B-cell receptor CD22-like [Salarias fasciatus]
MERWIVALLVILPGVCCADWSVTLADQCVLKGASVVMKCRYDYPFATVITSTGWLKKVPGIQRPVLLSSLYPASDRFRYVGNSRGNCDLQISDVQLSDEGAYHFSFASLFSGWTSITPAYLSVRELTAAAQPSTVTEGDQVRLTCRSGCPGPVPIVWFRDGQPVPEPDFRARREHAGSYHCAVRGQESVRSAPVALSVQYAPVDVRVYMSPQTDIIQGGSVTLLCLSSANPAVVSSGYSLFKDGQLIGSGWLHTISDIQPSHTGRYHCQARNNISRGGADRFSSAPVRLDVQYPPRNVSVTPRVLVEGGSVNVTCSSDANPAAHSYTWYRRDASGPLVQAGSGPVLSLPSATASDAGLYLCKAINRLGASNSSEVLLTLETKQPGLQTLPVLAGVGASLVVMLMIALLLFWRKQKTAANSKTQFDMRVSGRSPSSSAEDPSDTVYANVYMTPSSPPPSSAGLEMPHYQARSSNEDEVTYSTVTIKPKAFDFPHQTSDRRGQNSWSASAGNSNSVVYATVAPFS